MAVGPILGGGGGGDYSTGPWSAQSDDIVRQDIQDALDRNNGDVAAAAEDLRIRRNDPHNFYDTNMAMAEDYLFARADAGNKWVGGPGSGNAGTIEETAKINGYMQQKQENLWDGIEASVFPPAAVIAPFFPDRPQWMPVFPQGAGPISPYSDKEKEWMLKGADDAGKLDGASPFGTHWMNEPPYYLP